MSTHNPSPCPGDSRDRPAIAAHVTDGTDPRSAIALAARARRRGAMRSQLAVLVATTDPGVHRRAVLALHALRP